MQNPFSNPAFSMANLTAAINLLPNRYGRLESLNLFPVKPVRFRQILIEEKNGVLNLLPTLPVGSPGMDGPEYNGRKDPYDVLLVTKNLMNSDVSTRVFTSYR